MLDRMNRRMVKATKQHTEECKKLLKLMGIPVIQAPCEAEAQCASLVQLKHAFAAGSEDMDTLTFGAPVLLRHLTFSEARKMPISEVHLTPVLEGLGITMEQFIDLCILLGCDYCDSIKGIGPTRAVALIKQYGSIERIIENLDKEKYPIPTDWPFADARELFKRPCVLSADDPQLKEIRWEMPDEAGIIQFMVTQNGFNEKRIRSGIEKLAKARSTSTQARLDNFFKILPSNSVAGVAKRKEIATKKPTSGKDAKRVKLGKKVK